MKKIMLMGLLILSFVILVLVIGCILEEGVGSEPITEYSEPLSEEQGFEEQEQTAEKTYEPEEDDEEEEESRETRTSDRRDRRRD